MQPNGRRTAIAGEVRAEMGRQQKTHRELAAVLGLDQGSTSLRINGHRSFRAEELADAAEWLGVPVTTFLPPSRHKRLRRRGLRVIAAPAVPPG